MGMTWPCVSLEGDLIGPLIHLPISFPPFSLELLAGQTPHGTGRRFWRPPSLQSLPGDSETWSRHFRLLWIALGWTERIPALTANPLLEVISPAQFLQLSRRVVTMLYS